MVTTKEILKAAATAKLKALQLQVCFDPHYEDSRPNEAQDTFFKDAGVIKFRYLIGGNGSGKCLQSGTLVSTPTGPVAIEDLKVGDMVYSEHGQPIRVKNVWYQGKQEVYPIVRAKRQIASATANHRWQLEDGSIVRTDELSGNKLNRVRIKAPLGSVDQPAAYALGALLGDGCGVSAAANPQISSEDHEIPNKVAISLNCGYKKLSGNNYTWELFHSNKKLCIPHYNAWSKTYAHLKVADLDVITTWNRKSVLNFVAGLIDTDGSVYYKDGKIRIVQFGCQSKSIVQAVQWCLLALFNVQTTINVDSRAKYVNGPVYEIKVTDQVDTDEILNELGPLLIIRKNIPKVARLVTRVNRFNVQVRTERKQVVDTYDIEVDSDTHLFLLANGYVTHNSQVGGREITWILQDLHPYWKMPEDWKNRPLQCLVIGKSRSILENELWTKKIKPFFAKGDWKETRSGNVLQSVTHRKDGHKIIFLSHSDGSQKSIDNLQAYDADIVWVDEMPAKQAVLEETQRRTRRPNTLWFATFTPKSVNIKIRKQIDAVREPISKRYRMSRLDVPGVNKDAEMMALDGLTNAQKKTILYGDWAVGDEHVYDLQSEDMVVDLPIDYSKSWRHVESVDPGSNRGGLTIWAEHPKTKVWYCVKAEYIDGLRDPVAFYDYCQDATKTYNITRRVCDPAGTPHLGHAAARKCTPAYCVPYAKNQGRKEELIKNFQKLLSNGKLKIVDGYCAEFIDELSNAQRNDSGKIINSHSYHLADCAHYFADLIPEPIDDITTMSRDAWILSQDNKRRAAEAKEYEKHSRKQSQQEVHRIIMNLHRGKRWT